LQLSNPTLWTYPILDLKGHSAMKKLLITAAILTLLTACNKTPENTNSATDTATESAQHESDAQLNDNTAKDQAKEREAEAAAIAHDRYDPDSIYDGADDTDIPPPQLKRKLLPSEALEVTFRPVDAYPNFIVITQTIYDSTRLRVVSQIDDVLDKVETDNPNCKVTGVEPYTVKFPNRTYYGDNFNLLLDGCTSTEINEVYLYTTRGKITYRAIVEE
jgi:hypothetical protein